MNTCIHHDFTSIPHHKQCTFLTMINVIFLTIIVTYLTRMKGLQWVNQLIFIISLHKACLLSVSLLSSLVLFSWGARALVFFIIRHQICHEEG